LEKQSCTFFDGFAEFHSMPCLERIMLAVDDLGGRDLLA
jgi:hypothetical protein